MKEGYSLDKFRKAPKERLDPEKENRLETLRELKSHWQTASLSGNPREILKQVQSFRYTFGRKLKKEHTKLEVEQRDTKAGQIELAQAEAHIFNDTFDDRAERLALALAHKDESPDAETAYRLALARFDEIVEDLKESDLEKYARDIRFKQAGVLNFKKGVDADPWHPTPEATEAKLLVMLEKLPHGGKARELYMRLQDPNLDEKEFFEGMEGFRGQMERPLLDGKSVSHVITKALPANRILRVRFNDNGYISFDGKDPEHDKRFASSSGSYDSGPGLGDVLGGVDFGSDF